MSVRSLWRRWALTLVTCCAFNTWATDSTIGDTSATSHEIQFCSGGSTPYTGCLAADLRRQADRLATPVAIYESLRNTAEFAIYQGARAGAINAVAGGRGNDVDLAAALISMLRSQGYPARYAVGSVRIPGAQVMNWLAVENVTLAASLLNNQGIQNVVLNADNSIDMEHTWVEVLVPYDNYRGAGPQTLNCATTPAACHWVPLDPSFKQRQYHASGLDPYASAGFGFDYDSYYKAIINKDATRKDKNPLEIYQNQVLAWLQTNAPGKTLADIPDFGAIVAQQDGLLPASLPYALTPGSSVRRYNSVADHDAAVPATEAKRWLKTATVQVQIGGSSAPGGATVSLVDAATQRLTFTFDPAGSGYTGVFRLNGTPTGTAVNASGAATVNGQAMALGTALKLQVSMDGNPGVNGGADYVISATYDAVIGGYYLLATGGETSNWGQVHQAAQQLLQANLQYAIVYNTAETGCTVATGLGCTPYVDVNSSGGWDAADPKLVDSKPALDALSGGLLEVAAQQYYARVREGFAQLDAINRIRTPIVGFLGVVSATHSAQYLDGTAFAIEPGGLLIDMKGITLGGTWRIDQPAAYSNSHFELAGHILSALEHETWQELTGFDAISTLRGIQIALANNGALLNFYRDGSNDTFPTAYPGFGFSSSVPAGFSPRNYSLFGQTYTSWAYSGGSPSTAGFEAILANSAGIPAGDPRLLTYSFTASNGIDAVYSNFNTLVQQLNAWQALVGQLKTNVSYDVVWAAEFGTHDIINYSLTADSATGFNVASATRTASDTYRFVLNETAQHTDNTYLIKAYLNMAAFDNSTRRTLNFGSTTVIMATITAAAGSGFSAQYNPATDVIDSHTVAVTLVPTGSLTDGVHSVALSGTYLFSNGGPLTQGSGSIGTVNVTVINGRVVDRIDTVGFNLNTSDPSNYQIQCQGGAGGALVTYTGTPSQLMSNAQGCFNNVLSVFNWAATANFFNGTAPRLYRATPTASTARLASSVAAMRDTLYQENTAVSWNAYRSPAILSTGASFSFGVDYLKETNTGNGRTKSASYLISNTQVPGAGGGFVTATNPLIPAQSIDPISFNQPGGVSILSTYINAMLTDKNNIAAVNNDLIRTALSTDPVSTVTGNNVHDETDFTLKGRAGLNYAFTRSYNSAPSATKTDLGLGYGWVHSYGMRLMSNDYGQCPNCTSVQAPENGNGKTSSITYTDERGGDHNYRVNESSYAVSAPQGEFDSLVLDSPTAGQNTLTFRNGTKYVFENVSADGTTLAPGTTLKSTPGIKSRLLQIADPWGNQLNFTYTAAGRLATVKDNLGIAGRSGLVFTYDASNHLTAIADWSSRSWGYSVNASGNLASYTNPLSQTITYGYGAGSALHNLLTVAKPLARNGVTVATTFVYYQNGRTFSDANALGHTETLDYDLYRKSTRITDPRGGIRDYEYDSAGRLTQLIEPDGAILQFQNQSDGLDGLRYRKTDGLGYPTTYSYRSDLTFNTASDTSGNVTREQDALGQTVDTTYGLYDQVATVKDKRGTIVTTSFYSGSGTCIAPGKPNTVTLSTLSGTANVKLKSFCWNSDGTLAAQTDYLSPTDTSKTRVTTYTYETAAHLNVQSITVTGWDSAAVTKSYTYDTLGRPLTETLARRTSPTNAALINLTVTTTWDALDRAIQVQDAAGNLALNRFDANGQLWQVTHQYKKPDATYLTRNLVTRSFDAADRVIKETDALNGDTSYTYDAAGNVLSVTDADTHTLQYQYDAMNRRTAVTDANGRTVRTTYDQAGHPIAVSNGAGETTTTAYDKIGRAVSVTDPHNFISTVSYDANNNPLCVIDANAQAGLQPKNSDGCSVSSQYDELNRPTQVKDALNGLTQLSYDLLGNPLTRIDAEGRQYAWNYDGLGRLKSETDFAGYSTSYTLDEAGNPWQTTNRLAEITKTTFDSLNRPTNVSYLKDGTNETLSYEPPGNLVGVANATVSYTLAYDSLNRLTSKIDSRGRSLSFTWDKSGHILNKTTYQGSTTSYTYDGAGTLVAVTNPDYLSVNYQYDNAGRLLSRVMSSGARSYYGYDSGGWLNSLSHTDAVGATVSNQSYTRDRVGNITGINVTAGPITGSTAYTLDALYRLTTVDAPGTVNDEAFSYDHLGNRLTATRGGTTIGAAGSTTKYSIYTAATQTGTLSGYAPNYNNRLKEIHVGSVGGTIDSGFTFDTEGRLTGQTGTTPRTLTWDAKGRLKTLLQAGSTETYSYDPSNHRIRRSGGTLGTLDYYLEGEHLESVEQSGSLVEKYFRGSTIDELVAGYTTQAGKLTPFMFQHDQVMSVSAETKPNGGTQATLSYFAFGESQATTGAAISRLQYTGRENDPSGCYYYRARYYCPGIGFISEDPKKFAAGPSFYAYANNNPINANDPTGLTDMIYSAGALSRYNPIITNTNIPGANYLVAGPHGETVPMGAGVYQRTVQQGRPIDQVFDATQTSAMVDWGRSHIQNTRLWGATGNASLFETTIQSRSGGDWDTKQYLPYKSAYVINGKAELRDYVGNAIWGTGVNSLGISQDTALQGAKIQGAFSSVGQEDTRDQEAIRYGFSLSLYPNRLNNNQVQSVYIKGSK